MSKLDGCYCPMGCGETLYERYGEILCTGTSESECPRETAAHEILSNCETEHIVDFSDEKGFSVQHPLRERLNGDLFTCDLHERLQALSGAPVTPGKYRVFKGDDGRWGFTRIGLTIDD